MNSWVAVAPSERAGAWEGRLRLLSAGSNTPRETKTDECECGHLHGSSAEALQCSQERAENLNHLFRLSASMPAQRMPPDYYLG